MLAFELCEILRTPFLQNTSGRLLLKLNLGGMVLFRTEALQHTYRDWMNVVAKIIVKNTHQKQAINGEIVNKQHLVRCIKGGTRLTHRERMKVMLMFMNGVNQEMLVDIFINNNENKKDLIKLLYFYFQKDEGRNLFEMLLIMSSFENT